MVVDYKVRLCQDICKQTDESWGLLCKMKHQAEVVLAQIHQKQKVGNTNSDDAKMKDIFSLLMMTQQPFDVILFSHGQKFTPCRCTFFICSWKRNVDHMKTVTFVGNEE